MTFEEETEKSKKGDFSNVKFGVKLKKVPPSAKLKDVKTLLNGIKVKNVLFQPGGTAFVFLTSSDAVEQALSRSGSAIGKHKVIVRPLPKIADKKARGTRSETTKRQFFPTLPQEKLVEEIEESGRLYIRNLSYECTEKDLDELLAPFGLLTEVHVPYDIGLQRNRGFGFATFMHPSDAVKAFNKLDRSELHGRKIHILPGRDSNLPDPVEEAEENEEKSCDQNADSSFKKAKLANLRKEAGRATHTWNSLFVNPSAVAEVQAAEMGVSKEQLLDSGTRTSAAVRLAQVELALLSEIEQFLDDQGVHVDQLKKAPGHEKEPTVLERSRSAFLIKNLPAFTTVDELKPLVSEHGAIERLVVSPKGVMALVEFKQSLQARRAYAHVAFAKFKDTMLKAEWAPLRPRKRRMEKEEEVEEEEEREKEEQMEKAPKRRKKDKAGTKAAAAEAVDEASAGTKPNVVLVRNVPFQASQRELEELFRPFGSLARVRLPKKAGGGIRGFAFVEFDDKEAAQALLSADKKLHLYGRRLRLEAALAETDLAQMRANAFDSLVSIEEAERARRKRKKRNDDGADF